MTKFVENILKESRYFDKNTQELIDLMVYGFRDPYDEYDLLSQSVDSSTDDAALDALVRELNNLAKYKDYVSIGVDKQKYELLQEAAKCPVIGKQHVIVDLGYSKVKITTECLYRAIKNQILQRALFPNQDGDGLYIRINKQLLHDNALAYQDEDEDSGWES